MSCSFVKDTDLTKFLESNLKDVLRSSQQETSNVRARVEGICHRTGMASQPAEDQSQSQILAYGDRPRTVQLVPAWGTSYLTLTKVEFSLKGTTRIKIDEPLETSKSTLHNVSCFTLGQESS